MGAGGGGGVEKMGDRGRLFVIRVFGFLDATL